MKYFKPVAFVSLITITLVTTLAFLGDAESNSTEKEPETKDLKSNYAIFSVDLPEKMEFAGELVPLDQIDVLESLDREILVNTYWQSQTVLFIKRANRYFPLIERVLEKYDVPDDFKYLAVAESGLTHAVSPARAVGFWQILSGTAREYGLEVNDEIDERYHMKNTEAGLWLQHHIMQEEEGLIVRSKDKRTVTITIFFFMRKQQDISTGYSHTNSYFPILPIMDSMWVKRIFIPKFPITKLPSTEKLNALQTSPSATISAIRS